jgi:hypothetical protein
MSAWNTSSVTDAADCPPRLSIARQSFMDAAQVAFTTMLAKLDDALFELAQSADGEFERGNYFDAIRELRLGRDTIETRFVERLLACWRGLERGDSPAQRHLGGQDRAEVIALTAAVRRAETECADALREVRDGLALTVGVPDGDEIIGPRQVFAAFEAACRDTPFDPGVRLIVLKFFERHVGVALPGLYRAVATALSTPVLPVPERALEATLDPLPPIDARVLSDNMPQGPADLDLSALIQRALAGGEMQGGEAMKLAATLKQHDAPGTRSRSASIDLARFATRPADSLPADLSQQMVLDMVALLFDSLFTDSAVPVSARLQIARLQIPFLRLALRDRAVLARRSHLGRRFFDQLIAVTRGWQEPLTPPQQDVLEALIDNVGESCMDDHRAFAAAAERGLADLRALALPAADPQQTQKSHRKALTARAERELSERRHQVGRLPDPVNAFLNSHWLQYLVDCLEHHGADASPWRQALATLDALLWSLSPKDGVARQRLVELRPRLTRRLRQGMDQVGVSMFEQEAFLETLDEILERAQTGQPVWDWQEESAIDALLNGEAPEPAPASVASVVELHADTPPRQQVPTAVAPASQQPVAEPLQDDVTEEVVSLDDLAAELDAVNVVPLELPSAVPAAVRVDAPADDTPPSGDEWLLSGDDGAPDAPTLDVDSGQAGEGNDAGAAQPGAVAEEAPPEPEVNSLEALLRRRGLKAVAQVEEVELTERSGRA